MSLTETQSKKIQILRGLAAIAVVFIHNTPVGLSQVFVRPFLNFGVAVFLFLSGFLSKRDRWNPKKRIWKVAVPYVIWTLLYVCAKNLTSPAAVPLAFLRSLILGNAAAIMYYIFVYCEFTLLIPLIEKLASSKYKYLGFLISPIEIVLMRSLPLVLGYDFHPILQRIVSLSCLGWFTYFYLGYLIGNQKITVKYSNTALSVSLVVSLLLQMAEAFWYYSLGNTNCGTQLKLTSILSGCLFALIGYKFICSEKTCNATLLRTIGDHSFGIYFSHLAVMMVLSMVPYYTRFVIYPFNAIVAVMVSFALCFVGKKILKKHGWILGL